MPFYKISKFDDGNTKYELCENKWELIEPLVNFPGKVSLKNCKDETIIISSISYWKLAKIDCF